MATVADLNNVDVTRFAVESMSKALDTSEILRKYNAECQKNHLPPEDRHTIVLQASIMGFSRDKLREFIYVMKNEVGVSTKKLMPGWLVGLLTRGGDHYRKNPTDLNMRRLCYAYAPLTQKFLMTNEAVIPTLTRKLGIDRNFAFIGVEALIESNPRGVFQAYSHFFTKAGYDEIRTVKLYRIATASKAASVDEIIEFVTTHGGNVNEAKWAIGMCKAIVSGTEPQAVGEEDADMGN